jgi:hypothetical protein
MNNALLGIFTVLCLMLLRGELWERVLDHFMLVRGKIVSCMNTQKGIKITNNSR